MSQLNNKTLSVVIPVFNEQSTIGEVIKRVFLAKLPNGWQKDVIIVDDGSTDGTREILNKTNVGARIIFRDENGGKGAALKDGFKTATGDYILIQDADLEYNPSDYQVLLKPIIDGKTQVVFGSRMLSGNLVPLNRIYFYGGLIITKIFNILFRIKITDVATCYKVFPRKYIQEIIDMPSGDFVFDVVELSHFLLRQDRNIVEVPISYDSRTKSKGKKLNWRHGWRCFRRIIAIYLAERFRRVWFYVKKWFVAFRTFTEKHPRLTVFLIFSFFFLIFFIVYFMVSTLSSGDDHFFHFRFAQEMLNNGFFSSFQNFKAIYFSRMALGNDYFTYYNFLFYLVAIPFTFIDPLYLGIKLYAVFAATAGFTLLYWCLKRFSIKNPFIWTLVILAITSVSSIWRFFLSRPYALAPSLLLLLVYFLYRKNRIGVFAVSFVYLFWHSSTFFFPICVVIAYYMIERFYREKGDWRCLLSGIMGTVVAIFATYLVSSGFLLFIKDTIFSIYWETILGKAVHISEGGELYPMDFFNFIQGNALIFATFVTALSVDIFSYVGYKFYKTPEDEYYSDVPKERRYLQTTVLVLTACFFLGTVTISARFGDYFTFFAALYIALSFDYARRLITISGGSLVRNSLATGLTIVLVYLFASNMIFLQQKLAVGQSAMEFYQIGSWLDRNSKPGDIVFEANWSWFTQLYYWSPKNYYIVGLEPRFMYNYSQNLYWKWIHISEDGFVCDQDKCPEQMKLRDTAFRQGTSTERYAKTEGDSIAKSLRNDFKTTYVVSSRDYKILNYIMDHNLNFERRLYNEAYGYYIFELKNKVEK